MLNKEENWTRAYDRSATAGVKVEKYCLQIHAAGADTDRLCCSGDLAIFELQT